MEIAVKNADSDLANMDETVAEMDLDQAVIIALGCNDKGVWASCREALDAALEVVRRDRFFDEGAGRKAILALFEALSGEQYDDLVREFRRKLSAALN